MRILWSLSESGRSIWHEVKEKVDGACRVLKEVSEESGELYPADVYLLWNELVFMRCRLDVKCEDWDCPPAAPCPTSSFYNNFPARPSSSPC